MRRDSIFYKLFKQFPGLLFELVDEPPPEAENYQFESVEVKETAFRIDESFYLRRMQFPKPSFLQKCSFRKTKTYITASSANCFCFSTATRFVTMTGLGS